MPQIRQTHLRVIMFLLIPTGIILTALAALWALDRECLLTINTAFNRYRDRGGDLSWFSDNTPTFQSQSHYYISKLYALLSTELSEITTYTEFRQYLLFNSPYFHHSISTTGRGADFHVSQFGLYVAPTASPNLRLDQAHVGLISIATKQPVALQAESSTGFWAVKPYEGSIIINSNTSWEPQLRGSSFTFWACESATKATPRGNITLVDCNPSFEQQAVVSIDVTQLSHLATLKCSYIPLKTLILKGLSNLRELSCSNTLLESLDLANCAALQSLDCSHNKIRSLNLTSCVGIQTLKCDCNDLATLQVLFAPQLSALDCSFNKLDRLDTAVMPALKQLRCARNRLKVLDVANLPTVEVIGCSQNQIEAIDLSHCLDLKKLYCGNNLLTALVLDGCEELQEVSADYNKLITLSAVGTPSLQYLNCSNNQLEQLDVSRCASLEHLYCNHNRLAVIDASYLIHLRWFDCKANPLKRILVSGCKKLCYPQDRCFSVDIESANPLVIRPWLW